MLHEDIIDPLVTDYIDRVTGEGLNYFNANATTRLNDFVKYLVSVIPDRQFGFYPLRSDQNIGNGNKAFGIGRLASGSPMIFPGLAQWTESGVMFGDKVRPGGTFGPTYETVGMIDFSGKVEGGFAFRENDFSIFYFLKHQRAGEFATSLYRGEGGLCPYFICDKSPDWFQAIAPEFSTSRFRPRGTTYIYDEIFGEDKKGLQIDWSQKETEKYYAPTAISFYDPDKDQTEPRFYCLNLNGNLNHYSMKFIYGRDPNMLSGNFLSPYVAVAGLEGQPVRYDMPKRFVAGAGATNDRATEYNRDGLPHIVPGILITKGNYSYIHEEIAQNMAEAIGLLFAVKPVQISGLQDHASNICSPKIVSLDYYKTEPKIYDKVLQGFANFTAKISSIIIEDYGRWLTDFIASLCGTDIGGVVRCFGGWTARSPIEKAEIRPTLNSGLYITGNQITGTYGNLKLGEFHNNGIVGFVSGYMDVSGNFSGFQSRTISGHSGFYYTGSYNVFPPYQFFEVQKITGYVSGFLNNSGSFDIFNSTHPYYNSGYFLSGQITDFTYSLIEQEDISGFQYGFLNNLLNSWEPFASTNKLSSSGYLLNGQFIEFLPEKIIEKTPVTGFRVGFMNGLGIFSGYSTGEGGTSGILLTGDVFSDDPNSRIFFPLDGNFVGFDGISGFDPEIGYEYSGFDFFDSSGFISFDQANPFFGTGEMTGLIGYKYIVYLSGEFSGENSITGVNEGFGLDFNGFFDGDTYFSGVEFDPLTNSFLNYGTGYLIGKIGTKNVQNFYGDPGFDNRPGFDPLAGYSYTGFSFPEGSGFAGINGNTFGTGYMSGFIGSRNFIDYTGIYSGFTGLLDKYNQYLPWVIFPNFEFTRGSGFIGSVPGYGLLTGVISTGDVSGDAAFVVSNIGSGLYLTGLQRTGINISGIDFGPIDFSIGNISGMVTGASYTLAIISGGTFFETGYTGFNSGTDSGYYDIKSGTYMSGHITGLSYITGNLSIGSGLFYELETGFTFESGYIDANVTSVTLTEAISVLLVVQDGVPETTSFTSSITGIIYASADINTGLSMETGSVSATITSIDHYTFLRNDVTGNFETGYYNISGLYRISTAYPAITGENIYYNISGVLLKTGSP
jgi:hypothetical protein